MPIEIRELVVRVRVTPQSPGEANSSASPASSADPAVSKDEIVAACVERVMEILQNKTER
jgi:hypothetical protein